MAYSGPTWNPAYTDQTAAISARGSEALAGGISQGLGAIGQAIDNTISKREQTDALTSRFELLTQDPQGSRYVTPELQEKFHGGSLGAKSGIMAQLMAQMDRDEKMAQQNRAYELQDRGLIQRSIGMANDANYQNAALGLKQQEFDRSGQPVNFKPLEGTNYMVSDRGAALPMKEDPLAPGVVTDALSGLGYFRDESGRPVSPDNILVQPGGPNGSLFLGGMGGAPLPPAAPMAPAKPSIVPLRGPATSAARPLVRDVKLPSGETQTVQFNPETQQWEPIKLLPETGAAAGAPGASWIDKARAAAGL